ncbi:hypothetical protein ACFOWE_18070 [Planomonospora corallina]|uniref:Uncharacterized protein n=1 Tax=Planomonospora corallina TaxID=1806052 RepID=A0ABV8I8K3_9ACTN
MSEEKSPAVDISSLNVKVWYGQVYLADEELDGDVSGDSEDSPTASAGVIRVTPGLAVLSFGIDQGEVLITVAVAVRDPGADSEGYEDIVETSFESPSGRVGLLEWSWDEVKTYDLPSLPDGPGSYRLRFHLKGLDAHAGAQGYYLQIWPEPSSDPTVLKATSRNIQYFLNPEGFNSDEIASGRA